MYRSKPMTHHNFEEMYLEENKNINKDDSKLI